MPMYVLKNPSPEIKKLYKLGRRIGQPGQFGYACLAEKTMENGDVKKCAVKVIRKDRFVKNVRRSYTNKMFSALRQEIDIMSKAKHKNVIQYEDSFEDRENLYIAMEACTGGELFDRIQEVQARRGFSEKDAAALLKQIFEGLNYLHSELKIAHCDLKPDNFLFVEKKEDSAMRIIDFGMAKFLDQTKFFRDLCGTPYYIAPEVWRGQYSNACDMWSMGVITFVMLFGYPPFHGQTRGGGECEKRIRKSIERGFNPVVKSGYGAHFPRAIARSKNAKDFIAKLLQMEPAKRMTAEEALQHPWIKGDSASEKFDPLVVKGIKTFSSVNRFKHMILENLVESLDDEEVKKLREQFKTMDEDGSGEVEITELAKVLGNLKPKEVKKIMESMDVDKDGKISITEFSVAFLNRKISSQQERMWKVFQGMDLNNDGVLDKEEIAKALGDKGQLSKEEAVALMKQVDKDGNGKIEYTEFLEAWHAAEAKKHE